MRAYDLANQLVPIQNAYHAMPGSAFVRFHNGKAQYIARSSFIQIDNAVVNELPDFAFSTSSLDILVRWLGAHDATQVPVKFSVLKHSVVVTIAESRVELPIVEVPDYEGADEIVLTPLLTNTYKVNIQGFDLGIKVLSLRSLLTTNSGLVTLTATPEGLKFKAHSANGSASTEYPAREGDTLPNQWENTYSLVPWTFAHEGTKDVEISFKANESKTLSPLMLTYKNGVIVVLAPSWR